MRELVVIEVLATAPRSLFQDDDGEARARQLLRENTAGRAGSDNDEVYGFALGVSALSQAVPPSAS